MKIKNAQTPTVLAMNNKPIIVRRKDKKTDTDWRAVFGIHPAAGYIDKTKECWRVSVNDGRVPSPPVYLDDEEFNLLFEKC